MTSDDELAAALAAAGLPPERPGADPDGDPLTAAMARAGLVRPRAADTDTVGDAGPDMADPSSRPNTSPTDLAAPAPRMASFTSASTVAEPAEPPPHTRLPLGAATGVGSMPGADVREAAATVVGELPLLPHLPELPARGVGADLLGRTVALLVDLTAEVVPTGWRIAARPGRDARRATDLLRGDVEAFHEACEPARPDWVKVQAAGPWTLAAGVELRTGHRALTDRGAAAELAASLAEGLRMHVAEVGAYTGAQVLVQLDEPGLPAVLAGQLPTASGYGTVAAVPAPEAGDVLRDLITALGVPVVVHCCADVPPVRLLNGVGAAGVGVDATRPAFSGDTALPRALDALGEVWDSGTPLLFGTVPALEPDGPVTSRGLARPLLELADRLGFARERLAELAVPTPTCGMAGASPDWARRALGLAREIGEALVDPPEGS